MKIFFDTCTIIDYLCNRNYSFFNLQSFNLSFFQFFNFHSLWLLICANLCQSVVYTPSVV